MTEDDVVNSQAFKVINLQIDQKVAELRAYMLSFQDRVNCAFAPKKYGANIRTRIHCENPKEGGTYTDLPAAPHEFKDMEYSFNKIKSLSEEIGELQRLKCSLTGDWDFCKGNLSDMIAVFGETIEGMEHEE